MTAAPVPKSMLWTGRVMSGIVVLLMVIGPIVFGSLKFDEVKKGMVEHGYPPQRAAYILLTEVCCGLVYLIPQTAVLGAILLTGYFGGAVATHVRVGENFAGPVVFGVITWLGLLLRDRRLWALLPLRRLIAEPCQASPTDTQSVDPLE